jgi:hypothetical protein
MSYHHTTFELSPQEIEQIATQDWRDLIPHMENAELFSWNAKICQTMRIAIDWSVGLTFTTEQADKLHNLRTATIPITTEMFLRSTHTHTADKAGN